MDKATASLKPEKSASLITNWLVSAPTIWAEKSPKRRFFQKNEYLYMGDFSGGWQIFQSL
ncbi:hypothetical protein [Brasilonema sp. UFV-L1]|uniref:hypothetical protein n=1 Tax=Brasilonema sp. UFV-L1 TaxID=2234130 RepID=UPI00145C4E60|nr:hypothetical protein [Brasilonema sp. UFV-L1]